MKEFFRDYNGRNDMALTPWEMVKDVKKFADSHITALKSNPRNGTFLPYYNRLLKLYNILNK